MAHPAYTDGRYQRARRRLIGRPCYQCGAPATQVDHIIPKSSGIPLHQLNAPDNLRPACRACNNARNRKPRTYRGRL